MVAGTVVVDAKERSGRQIRDNLGGDQSVEF
jgi:hypothetical protein